MISAVWKMLIRVLLTNTHVSNSTCEFIFKCIQLNLARFPAQSLLRLDVVSFCPSVLQLLRGYEANVSLVLLLGRFLP